ncbi:hypothetical protein Plhal304r1_c049g0130821 [Plasmopara halstedii]
MFQVRVVVDIKHHTPQSSVNDDDDGDKVARISSTNPKTSKGVILEVDDDEVQLRNDEESTCPVRIVLRWIAVGQVQA